MSHTRNHRDETGEENGYETMLRREREQASGSERRKNYTDEFGRVHFEQPQPAPAPAAVSIHAKIWEDLRNSWIVTPWMTLPTDSSVRKQIPIYSGVVAYAPAALACVAIVSKLGNDKHNPGEPLHHARSKSSDHPDCELRHMIDAADEPDELEHASCKAWRALIDLQLLCERLGAPMAPGARK